MSEEKLELSNIPIMVLDANVTDDDSDSGDSGPKSSNSSPPPSAAQVYSLPNVSSQEVDDDYRKAAETLLKHTKDEMLSNRFSAPYEISQYPIEIDEKKRRLGHYVLESVAKLQAEMRQQRASSEEREEEMTSTLEPKDPLEQFQKVSVSRDKLKDYNKGVRLICRRQPSLLSLSGPKINILAPLDDGRHAPPLLVQALELRKRYMMLSNQSFSSITLQFLKSMDEKPKLTTEKIKKKRSQSVTSSPPTTDNPWKIQIPDNIGYELKPEDGVIQCYKNKKDKDAGRKLYYPYVLFAEFISDINAMLDMVCSGPLKSFCYRRLYFLSSKYQLHVLLNEHSEVSAQKAVPHRDFYNVRKVDTHIHASSSMNQKHLLGFIKKTMRRNADDVVFDEDGKKVTLRDIFQSLNLEPSILNVDMLDCHGGRTVFHRQDKFNAKYNPVNVSRLRKIFLTIDNHVGGKYFASLLKEVICELEESKYQNAELRLTIYGRKREEWEQLAKWAIENNMYSDNVRWLIEVPRLYDVYRTNGFVKNFQELLQNIFLPLFEATNNPKDHKELFLFLQYVVGLDSVGDDSKPENPKFEKDTPFPQNWENKENPTYNYYLYYMYANLSVLNHFRKERGFNTFTLRPHCGETGLAQHLLGGFLLCEGISHGLQLRKMPVMQYLYYLTQIPIAMSPLSNNSLFLNYRRNPLPDYFNKGLFISLSTDDPLQFHFTREPLMEEYSIAAQLWKLSSIDMCELAHNSVLMSGFPSEVKTYWLGPNYLEEGVKGNDITRTNLPNIRVAYRYETLLEEHSTIFQSIKQRQ